MLSYEQNLKTVELQDKINSFVHSHWETQGFNWMLAGAMELMEAIDHYGWKWWKHSKQNIALAQNELVDYYHFVLSHSIIKCDGYNEGAAYWIMPNENRPKDVFIFDVKGYVIAEMSVVEKLFITVGLAAAGRFEFYLFESLMKDLDFTWDQLFMQYVGKHVLNIFRQENGYKTGEYIKNYFDGREDNEHMFDGLNEFGDLAFSNLDNFMQEMKWHLARAYAETIGQKSSSPCGHIGGEHKTEIKEQDKINFDN